MGKKRIPFIENMNEDVAGIEPCVMKIKKNGKYVTQNLDRIEVEVAGGSGKNYHIEGHALIIEN